MGRLIKIAFSLSRHDALMDLLAMLGDEPKIIGKIRRNKSKKAKSNLVEAFEALGPTFIKLGQALATRPDIIGAGMARELMSLQDKVPSFSSDEAKRIITEELGAPIEELFKEFTDKPIGAASIAQVHIATALDGSRIAVKVLRPGIAKKFEKDLEAFMWIAKKAEKYSAKARRLHPTKIVDVITESIALELDLRYEAAAASELQENMANNPDYDVPTIHWDKTSRRVLTTSWVDGTAFSDKEGLETAGYDRKKLAETLIQSFLSQALNDGFFHADLHQGNLFACTGSRITAIDFGIMGRLDRKDRRALAEILYGFIKKDYDRVAKAHFDVGYVPKDQSYTKFKQALRTIGEPVVGRQTSEFSAGKLLGQLFETTETFNMQTQPQLILLQKTMVTAEGVALDLYPEINMWDVSQPIIEAWIKKNLGPEGMVKDMVSSAKDIITKLPRAIDDMEQMTSSVKIFLEQAQRPRLNLFKIGFYILSAGIISYSTFIFMYNY